MTVTEFRKKWADAIRRANRGELIPITSHKTHVATLGPAVGGPQNHEDNADGASKEVAGPVAGRNGGAVRNKPKRNLKG